MIALRMVLGILLAFTAIGILCAVRISLRRPAQADPFLHPFGEMPGFTAEQLRTMSERTLRIAARDPLRRSFAIRSLSPPSAGLALRPADADGGWPNLRSWLASIGNLLRGRDAAA